MEAMAFRRRRYHGTSKYRTIYYMQFRLAAGIAAARFRSPDTRIEIDTDACHQLSIVNPISSVRSIVSRSRWYYAGAAIMALANIAVYTTGRIYLPLKSPLLDSNPQMHRI